MTPPSTAHPANEDRAELTPALHSEGRILSVLSQLAVMQVVLAATGVVRNKIVAYRLGPEAFGEVAQIAAVTGTVASLVSFGMAVGVSRNAAAARSDGERRAQLANANGIVLSLAAIACATCAVLLLTGRLLPLAGLISSTHAVIAAAIFIAAIPIDALKNNYLALLRGVFDLKALAIRRAVAVLLATAVAVPVVWFVGFVGAALQYLLLAVFVAVLSGTRCRALGYPPLAARLDRLVIVHLASFGLVSLTAGFAHSFADTAVRTSLINAAGAAANGLLQAPYVLSTMVKEIVLTSVGSISLATIAGQRDRAATSAAVDRLLNVVIPVAAAALGLLGLAGSHALTILYSRSFAPGATMFPYLLGADVLVVFAWVVGAPLLAFGDRALWLALELLGAFARWGLAILLLPRFGAVAVVVGYLCGVALQAVVNFVVFRRRYRLDVRPVHLWRLASGAALVVALSVVGSRVVPAIVYGSAVLAWLAYTAYYAHRTNVLPELWRRFGRGAAAGGTGGG
jgi:O-antigen/teichoic acid export membrane protein